MNDYAKLIQDVKKVDRIAALRLAREIPLLVIRKKLDCALGPPAEISNIFSWVETPQGHKYWSIINKKYRKML